MAFGKFCLSGRGTPKLYSLLIHRLNLTDSHFLSPPVPISSHKTDSTLVTAKTKPRPPESDILDSSHPQHRWNFSHKPTIASQTTALMNGRPSEFTSQVNQPSFTAQTFSSLPPGASLGSVQPTAAANAAPLLMMETFLRDAVAVGALIRNGPWLT